MFRLVVPERSKCSVCINSASLHCADDDCCASLCSHTEPEGSAESRVHIWCLRPPSIRPCKGRVDGSERWQAPAADPNMTEAALAKHRRGPTVTLMTRRRASAPAAQPPAVNASTSSETAASQTKRRSKSTPNSENVSGDSNEAKPAARNGTKAGGSNPTLHQNHPEDACRYPNKRCYNKRAMKNNGEMHKFCDMHRDSANRYQRKLEQRLKQKRIQSRMRALQVQQAQAHAQAQAQAQMVLAQAHGHTPFSTVDPTLMEAPNPMLMSPFPGMEVFGGVAASASTEAVSGALAPPVPFIAGATTVAAPSTTVGLWSHDEDKYEPFQHPVELQSEDLDCLNLLFHES